MGDKEPPLSHTRTFLFKNTDCVSNQQAKAAECAAALVWRERSGDAPDTGRAQRGHVDAGDAAFSLFLFFLFVRAVFPKLPTDLILEI